MQPIHFCATQGLHAVACRLLSETSIGIDCEVEDGRRALHMAVANNHYDLVQLLLSHDADPSAASADSSVPLQLALESGNESIAQLLIHSGADVNAAFANGETPLSFAVGNNSISHTRFLVKEQANPKGCLPDGRASLHVAAEAGCDIDIFMFLIKNGADPTSGDNCLWTPLHCAAHCGHRDAALVLIDDKRIDSVFERVGWTPLHAAIRQEHTEIVKLLIGFALRVSELLIDKTRDQSPTAMPTPMPLLGKARGTAENAPESSSVGRRTQSPHVPLATANVPTPLFLATSQNYLEGVNALLEAGVTLKDLEVCMEVPFYNRKQAILERLVLHSEEGIGLSMSLSQNAASNSRDAQATLGSLSQSFSWSANTISTAMEQVVKRFDEHILKYLIERLLSLEEHLQHQVASCLIDVLQTAVEIGNVEAVDSLQRTGMELSQEVIAYLGGHEPKKICCTLLHVAVQLPSVGVTTVVLGTISPNVTNAIGRTPLHYAVENL